MTKQLDFIGISFSYRTLHYVIADILVKYTWIIYKNSV